jgi:LysR family transcriptional regulator, transcriptional activator of nhaA
MKTSVAQLNFHHLRYFWAVAKDGNLTRTAERLHVAQSALSSQIQQLESDLGKPLFSRQGRSLALTEAGQLVLTYAEEIFTTGGELLATLKDGRAREQTLRLGAVATLSRNFQESFLEPVLPSAGVRLSLESGSFDALLERLRRLELDVVLANQAPPRAQGPRLRARRLARQPVSIVGVTRPKRFRFPADLRDAPLLLPGPTSALCREFRALCEQLGVPLRVRAEVDDMATLRLLARDTETLAVLPSVVVRDELREGVLHEHCVVPGLFETFYAITVERAFPHPLVKQLLSRDEGELLAVETTRRQGAPPARR